jgi:hypothetical protein
VEVVEPIAVESLNFRELKNLAKLLKIPGYSQLRQAAMLEAVKAKQADILPSHIEEAKATAKAWKQHGANRKA